MPDLTHISVPCPCGAKLLVGQTTCPSCHTPIPPNLRDALDARLSSSYPEYRDATREVSRASTLLLVLGALHLVVVLFIALGASGVPKTGEEAPLALLIAPDATIGVAFLACWRAAKRAPVAAMTAALSIWAVVRLALFLLSPAALLLSFLSAGGIVALMAKAAVFVVLVRAVLAARWLRTLQKSIARDGATGDD